MTLERDLPRTAGRLRPSPRNASPGSEKPADRPGSRNWGSQVEDLTPQVAEQLGVKVEHGVAITDVRNGSPADTAGLAAGMVITQADRQPVKTVADLRKVLAAKPLEQGLLLLVQSAQGSRFVVLLRRSGISLSSCATAVSAACGQARPTRPWPLATTASRVRGTESPFPPPFRRERWRPVTLALRGKIGELAKVSGVFCRPYMCYIHCCPN